MSETKQMNVNIDANETEVTQNCLMSLDGVEITILAQIERNAIQRIYAKSALVHIKTARSELAKGMELGLHVTKVTNQSASSLATARLLQGEFHNRIQKAAQEMTRNGRGDWKYGGQWHSGTVVWESPEKMYIAPEENK